MQIQKGTKAKIIQLEAIDGSQFNSENLVGKSYMIAFFRFASCPFCNMRMRELVTRYEELGDDFMIIAIFDSPLDNLTKHASGHQAPFPILADEANIYYKAYGIRRSFWGVLKGFFFRFPTLIKGLLKGHIPLVIKGNILTMPADFLVDKKGIIQVAYYGKDEGDHLDFEVIKAFIK